MVVFSEFRLDVLVLDLIAARNTAARSTVRVIRLVRVPVAPVLLSRNNKIVQADSDFLDRLSPFVDKSKFWLKLLLDVRVYRMYRL